MSEEFAPIDISMSLFTDEELGGLFACSTLWHQSGFEAVGILTAFMVRDEVNRRHHNRKEEGAFVDPGSGRIRLDQWSDRDIADSLRFCWSFAETTSVNLGQLIDALGLTFVQIAADRLRNSTDPRNSTGFEARNLSMGDTSSNN